MSKYFDETVHLQSEIRRGRLMRPKEMEDLAAFSARKVKRAAAEERERDKYSSAKGQ